MMITKRDLERLGLIEKRSMEIAAENGLRTTAIDFEVVSPQRMFESMAYHVPTNFSHWTFGRDYDRIRTVYEHTGRGIPYETIWNFEKPRAFLVNNNPFGLNAIIIPHCIGHVDHFLRSVYFTHGRSFADIAVEARYMAKKFREFERRYGKDEVEKLIDAAMALQWHQHPDPFYEEQDEEQVRAYLIEREMEKLHAYESMHGEAKKAHEGHKKACEHRLKELRHKTPPEPVYDLLKYVIDRAPRLEDWEREVLRLIRNQARALAPNRRVKLLAEGWATYWHTRIMRQLFKEGLLTPEENDVYKEYHAKVTQAHRTDLNVYCIGPAVFEYIKSRWDRGKFGKAYEQCTDARAKAHWDTKAMKGTEKIFDVSARYTDRMTVEEFFTDEFIHAQQLYIYTGEPGDQGRMVYKIVEDNPAVIRMLLKSAYTLYGLPQIASIDGNAHDRGEWYLRHYYYGYELHPQHRSGALMQAGYLWRRPVHLETTVDGKERLFTYDGNKHSDKQLMIFPKQS